MNHLQIFSTICSATLLILSGSIYSQSTFANANAKSRRNLGYCEPPYIIQNHTPNLEIITPLSTYRSGRVVVDIFINKSGKVDGFNMKHILLFNQNDEEAFRYFKFSSNPLNKVDYPNEVQLLYKTIKHYVDKLDIIKNPKFKAKGKNRYIVSMPLKLKSSLVQDRGLHQLNSQKNNLSFQG